MEQEKAVLIPCSCARFPLRERFVQRNLSTIKNFLSPPHYELTLGGKNFVI